MPHDPGPALELFRRCLDQAPDGVVVMDATGVIIYGNRSFFEQTGLAPETMLGRHARFLWSRAEVAGRYAEVASALRGGGTYRAASRVPAAEGGSRWLEHLVAPVIDANGVVTNLIALARDVTEARLSMGHDSYDPVTGLPGRRLIQERAKPMIALARREKRALAVLRLEVEPRTGGGAAIDAIVLDRVLQATARRLGSAVRDSDLVGRGPDGPFTLVLQEVRPDETLGRVAMRMLTAAREPLEMDGVDVELDARVGIALFPRDASGWDELLDRAEAALERARAGGTDFMFDHDAFTVATRERLQLETDFARASEASEFLLHFQPVVATASGRVVGAEALARGQVVGIEALARWPHHQRGIVAPAEFIPIAEETGHILSLDRWVAATAIRQAALWWQRGWTGWISVNLSMRSVRDPSITDYLARLLETHGVDPERLVLEVTESVAMRDPATTAAILRSLKALGVRIAIDDFGTGHSSLAYLRNLPVDLIKLDRSFLQDLGKEEKDRHVVEAIVALAHRIGAQIVAEGVEEQAQLEWLRSVGCDLAQGFLTGRPGPADSLDADIG